MKMIHRKEFKCSSSILHETIALLCSVIQYVIFFYRTIYFIIYYCFIYFIITIYIWWMKCTVWHLTDSLWYSWHWCSLNREHLDLLPGFELELCRLKTQSEALMHNINAKKKIWLKPNNAGRCGGCELRERSRPSCSAGALYALHVASICVVLSTGSERHRKWQVDCDTYRGGYSCICFCSCFLASGLLCGDTAVCTPAAEVPDRWQIRMKRGERKRHFSLLRVPGSS